MACVKKKSEGLDDVQKKILEALARMSEPSGCGEIAKAAGLSTPQVMGKLRGLKSQGYVDSPVKGKYLITEKGRKEVAP